MPKLVRRRRAKKFQYEVNRKKLNQKKRKQPKILNETVRKSWDRYKGMKANLNDMGLALDPNDALSSKPLKTVLNKQTEKPKPTKLTVLKELEEQAAIPSKLKLRLSEPNSQYCIYMMQKYGEDYKAMARDKKNYYQDTPNQIKNKIKSFMKIPELAETYQRMVEMGEDVHKLVTSWVTE